MWSWCSLWSSCLKIWLESHICHITSFPVSAAERLHWTAPSVALSDQWSPYRSKHIKHMSNLQRRHQRKCVWALVSCLLNMTVSWSASWTVVSNVEFIGVFIYSRKRCVPNASVLPIWQHLRHNLTLMTVTKTRSHPVCNETYVIYTAIQRVFLVRN